jgi:hypothetical protein
MVTKVAIVTLAVGETYLSRWKHHCERGWRNYAQNRGYDLVVIDKLIDETPRALARSPAWQKCLILHPSIAGAYERIIWMDSDILINAGAPDVLDDVPLEMIGATDEHTFPTAEERRRIIMQLYLSWQRVNLKVAESWKSFLDAADWHAHWGLPRRGQAIVQTGVMVLSPRHHRDLFEHVYYNYEDNGGEPMNFEMRPMSFEIQERRLLHVLDHRFNALFSFLMIKKELELRRQLTRNEVAALMVSTFDQNYFLHLAGLKLSMDDLLPQIAAR